jgi:hypothetical protein
MMQSAFETIEGMVRQDIHPKEVAKVVFHAIDNPKPKLRYFVGKDAEEFIEASRKLSEEELFQTVSRNILKRG